MTFSRASTVRVCQTSGSNMNTEPDATTVPSRRSSHAPDSYTRTA